MSSRHRVGMGLEHPYSHHIQFGSVIVFFIVWLMDTFFIQAVVDIRNAIPLVIRIILFLITTAISFLLMNYSHNKIFSNSKKQSLVSEGIYSIIRHPMYLSIPVFMFAFTLLSFSFLSFLTLIIVFLLFDRMVAFEESELVKILGEEYLNYTKKVPRWIPRLSSIWNR